VNILRELRKPTSGPPKSSRCSTSRWHLWDWPLRFFAVLMIPQKRHLMTYGDDFVTDSAQWTNASRPCATVKVEGNRTASLWQSSSRSYGLYIARPGLIKHEQHDPVLKRRFEEGVASAELRQYLRLHQRDLDFRQTPEKARIFAATMGETKAKKSLRFMSESPAPAIHHIAVPTIDFTPVLCRLDDIEKKVAGKWSPETDKATSACIATLPRQGTTANRR